MKANYHTRSNGDMFISNNTIVGTIYPILVNDFSISIRANIIKGGLDNGLESAVVHIPHKIHGVASATLKRKLGVSK